MSARIETIRDLQERNTLLIGCTAELQAIETYQQAWAQDVDAGNKYHLDVSYNQVKGGITQMLDDLTEWFANNGTNESKIIDFGQTLLETYAAILVVSTYATEKYIFVVKNTTNNMIRWGTITDDVLMSNEGGFRTQAYEIIVANLHKRKSFFPRLPSGSEQSQNTWFERKVLVAIVNCANAHQDLCKVVAYITRTFSSATMTEKPIEWYRILGKSEPENQPELNPEDRISVSALKETASQSLASSLPSRTVSLSIQPDSLQERSLVAPNSGEKPPPLKRTSHSGLDKQKAPANKTPTVVKKAIASAGTSSSTQAGSKETDWCGWLCSPPAGE